MQKPNVLHVINNLNVSGATMLLLDIAAHVRPAPGELTVCTLEPENPMAEALLNSGARVIIPGKRLGLVSATKWVREIIQQSQAEIVHTHLLPATQVGLAAARLAGTPAVTTVHFTFESLRARPLLQRLNQVSFRCYKRIFAISDAVKGSILKNCGIPDCRVVVLRSGIDLDRAGAYAEGLRQSTRRRLGLADGQMVIGSIGRLEKVKGFHLLIAAMAELRGSFPDARLVLVGDGAERDRLQRQAADLHLGDEVIFAGLQKDTSGFLAAFDIFVLPSLFEGLGLSIVEAMSAGLPVVGSTAGGIPEVVTHGTSGLLFEAGNAGALAECLRELVESADLRRRLALAGKAQAEEEFAIARYVERLYGEYASILSAAPDRALAESTV